MLLFIKLLISGFELVAFSNHFFARRFILLFIVGWLASFRMVVLRRRGTRRARQINWVWIISHRFLCLIGEVMIALCPYSKRGLTKEGPWSKPDRFPILIERLRASAEIVYMWNEWKIGVKGDAEEFSCGLELDWCGVKFEWNNLSIEGSGFVERHFKSLFLVNGDPFFTTELNDLIQCFLEISLDYTV